MPRCAGTKRNGERCTATVEPPQTLCWWHDPANAEKRRRAASRGGRAKANPVARELHELLEGLIDRVMDGTIETGRGAVANQLITTRIKLLEYERRAKETEEFEERLAALERARRAV